jgi:tetratricopeptide (TPR) repeat protein
MCCALALSAHAVSAHGPVASAQPPDATPRAEAPAGPGPTRPTFRLDEQGRWITDSAPQPGSDEDRIARARRLLADGQSRQALGLLTEWLERHARTQHPLLPGAYLARGDAWVAEGNEFEALYDYETIIKSFPGTVEYVHALEREFEIAVRYLHGLNRRWWFGLRIINAFDVGEELLVRIHERLPGSRLAERAMIELADHYYRQHDLVLAATAYEMFARNFPASAYRQRADLRRIYAVLGRFKGPRYDGTPLLDAQVLVQRYQARFPGDAPRTDGLVTWIDESKADQYLEQARWYLQRGDPVSARVVLRRLLAEFPASSAARSGREIMAQRRWDEAPAPTPPDRVNRLEPVAPTSSPATTPATEEPRP